ncbi:MAG: PDDEXK nuclease domain-containing protein [Paludibacteraceae bacterium]|nr:PDDEXK nuclease domain-containing protein [Paludibacteraceae bacterium]
MSNKTIQLNDETLIADLKGIVRAARQLAYSAVNYAQVKQNWHIGRRLVEQEQNGNIRAEYGKKIIEHASEELTKEFGKGFSPRSLWKFRQFYILFRESPILPTLSAEFNKEILPTLSAESRKCLSWSHYERLMRITDSNAREWYIKEATEQMWPYKTLNRNINTLYYERLLSSQLKGPVKQEMQEKTAEFLKEKFEFIKNPAVLEFLGLPSNLSYTESKLEQTIIDQMQHFLLELGKGFSFVARQQLIRTETSDFYIDLVFYNYILKCFVIVELKTHEITHQDIGQLDMYVQMYDDLKKSESDNPTIGILLCTETDKTIARYSVLNKNKQLFAAKYLPLLPTEEELRREIERQKEIFMLQQQEKEEDKL